MREKLKIIKQMDMENFMELMDTNIRVSGKIICQMVVDRLHIQMEVDILDSF